MDYFELISKYPAFFNNMDAPIKIISDREKILDWENSQNKNIKNDFMGTNKIGIVYQDSIVLILKDLVEFPSGKIGGYIRLFNRGEFEGGKGVVILPIYQGKIVLIHHFRHATRLWHWELPRGFGESGVLPINQARKEVHEEIGGRIEKIEEIGSIYINTGLEGNQTKIFIIWISSIGDLETEEGISDFHMLSIKEFEEKINTGEINDGFTISAFTKARIGNYL